MTSVDESALSLKARHTDIIAKLEGASAGNRHLDYEIKDALNDSRWNQLVPPDWSTSLDASLSLVEEKLPGAVVWVVKATDGSGESTVLADGRSSVCDAAATPPLAVLLALFKALEAQ